MVDFYRVENSSGVGPYTISDVFEDNYCYFNTEKHPGPEDDRLLRPKWIALGDRKYDFVFGFESFRQLLNWFDIYDLIPMLSKYGYNVSIYEAEYIITGSKQVIANKNNIKLKYRVYFL